MDFCCYARILPDGMTLLWREKGELESKRLIFDCFSVSSLERIPNSLEAAFEVRTKKQGVSPITKSQHWEFAPRLDSGVHQLVIEHDWSIFEETLVLADHGEANGFDKMSRAIFAFDWRKRRVEVFPQDWFNSADYDFGYQWITRVARREDESIVGDGVRLGSFELDSSNRQIKRWLGWNPFQMIQ